MDCEMFRCTRCSKCFKIRRNLERHLATHHQHDDGNTGSATSRPPAATPSTIREEGEITPPVSPAPSSLLEKGASSALLGLAALREAR